MKKETFLTLFQELQLSLTAHDARPHLSQLAADVVQQQLAARVRAHAWMSSGGHEWKKIGKNSSELKLKSNPDRGSRDLQC